MWASERTASQVGLELESKFRAMLKFRLEAKVEAEPAGALDEQMSLLADCWKQGRPPAWVVVAELG